MNKRNRSLSSNGNEEDSSIWIHNFLSKNTLFLIENSVSSIEEKESTEMITETSESDRA